MYTSLLAPEISGDHLPHDPPGAHQRLGFLDPSGAHRHGARHAEGGAGVGHGAPRRHWLAGLPAAPGPTWLGLLPQAEQHLGMHAEGTKLAEDV